MRVPTPTAIEFMKGRSPNAFTDQLLDLAARRFSPGSKLARAVGPVVSRAVGGRPLLVTVAAGPARGIRLLIDSNNEKFLWSGHHEQHVLAELERTLGPGDCLWDVGAHIGYVSCFASRIVSPGGAVVAFEPQPRTRERLERAVMANGFDNVVVSPFAIARVSGPQALFADEASARSSLQRRDGRPSMEVNCVTLDDAREHAPTPAGIKVDVEGLELDVLRGGRELLRDARPWLLVEFSSESIVRTARGELPEYSFRLLAQNHWFLTPR